MKDTKLLSNFCRLDTTKNILARRIRSDDCHISSTNGDIVIGSYVEASKMHITTESGNINVGKKIGVNERGVI